MARLKPEKDRTAVRNWYSIRVTPTVWKMLKILSTSQSRDMTEIISEILEEHINTKYPELVAFIQKHV